MSPHDYDPDDNFGQAFHAQAGIDDEDALEAVAWQFLLLVNPDDEDAALQQFAAFRAALEDAGGNPDPALLLPTLLPSRFRRDASAARGIGVAVGLKAYVRDGIIEGEAPNLPTSIIEI